MPAGAFVPSKLHIDYGEWTPPAIGSTDTGKAWVWNNATAKYEPAAFEPLGNAASAAAAAVSTHVAASDPHSQYLLSSAYTPVAPGGSTTQVQYNNAGAFAGDAGMTYDAATDRLTVAGGLVAPSMRPASNSTSALGWLDAAGTQFVYGDTTNQRVGIGGIPTVPVEIFDNRAVSYPVIFSLISPNAQGGSIFRFGKTSLSSASWTWADAIYLQTTANAFPVIFQGSNIQFSPAGNETMRISGGRVMIGQTSATALLDLAASTTARASLRIRNGTWPTTPNDGDIINDGNSLVARVNGTNAVNTDGGLSIWMQSSTTARNVGRLLWQYTDKTDATRKTQGALTAFYTSTEHKPISWGADSGGALLSFYNVTTPIARQLLALGSSGDDIINALANLGLTRLS